MATPRHDSSSYLPVTGAAIAACRRLQQRVPDRLLGHERPERGLICEQRHGLRRPVFYRVTVAGAVEADQLLDMTTLRFAPAPPPAGLA
jgi:hypothetical protein